MTHLVKTGVTLTISLLVFSGLALLNLGRLLPDESLSEKTQQGTALLGMGCLVLAMFLFVLRRWVSVQLVIFGEDTGRFARVVRERSTGWIKQESRWHQFALGFCLLIGITMRQSYLWQPIRTDEALTYMQFASKPLYLALSDYAAPNNHLFHTLFVHLSTRLFGSSEEAIRLPAFIAGILVIPATYIAIRALYNKHAALLAAAFIASSSVMVEYSTNARGYTIQTVLFLLCLTLGQHLIHSRNRAAWGLFSLCAALAFYTIPTFLYAYGALMLWLMANIVFSTTGQNRTQQLKVLVVSGIATVFMTAILYAPAILVSGVGAITGNIYVEPQPFSIFLQQLPASFAETWAKWHIDIPLWFALILLLGFLAGLVRHRQNAQHPVPFVLPVLVWCIPLLLIQRVIPFTRVWLYFLPVYVGITSVGVIATLTYITRNNETRKRKGMPIDLLRYIPLSAILIVLILGFSVFASASPRDSLETGRFNEAELVTAFFSLKRDKQELEPDAKILYEHPSGESLMYYFGRQNIPLSYLERDFSIHPVMYLVVNRDYPQTAESVLKQNGIAPESVKLEELVATFGAAIYRAVPVQP